MPSRNATVLASPPARSSWIRYPPLLPPPQSARLLRDVALLDFPAATTRFFSGQLLVKKIYPLVVQFRHVCGGTGALAKACGEARTGSDRIVRAVSFGAGNKAARNAGPIAVGPRLPGGAG